MSNEALAVVFERPGQMALRSVSLPEPERGDCLVEVEWTGISTGTERLLWDGRMPPFPGLAYPLVPGYECVGRVLYCNDENGPRPGERVFVPGSRGFLDAAGLFGAAAAQLVVPAERVVRLPDGCGEESVLLALAATACHIAARAGDTPPELIVGHGVLGRLLARVVMALGGTAPTVWEANASRRDSDADYPVIDPADDTRTDYRTVCDVSGDAATLNPLVNRLQPGGSAVLAGFYHEPLSLEFAAAFIREVDIRVAAQWQPQDMSQAATLVASGALSLDGLITDRQSATRATSAYRKAFGDPECLKMILDWRPE